jgi:hypothetical protein
VASRLNQLPGELNQLPGELRPEYNQGSSDVLEKNDWRFQKGCGVLSGSPGARAGSKSAFASPCFVSSEYPERPPMTVCQCFAAEPWPPSWLPMSVCG